MQEEEAHNSCKTRFCEEQVAEAALLSIGGVLEWQLREPARSWEATEFKAQFDTEVDGEEGEIIYLVRTWRADSLRAHVAANRFLSDGVWDGGGCQMVRHCHRSESRLRDSRGDRAVSAGCGGCGERMTEDEAEAALVALSDPLQWSHRNGTLVFTGAKVGRAAYTYQYNHENKVFRVAYCPDITSIRRGKRLDITQREYDSETEAKAACERHHATGKWTE